MILWRMVFSFDSSSLGANPLRTSSHRSKNKVRSPNARVIPSSEHRAPALRCATGTPARFSAPGLEQKPVLSTGQHRPKCQQLVVQAHESQMRGDALEAQPGSRARQGCLSQGKVSG